MSQPKDDPFVGGSRGATTRGGIVVQPGSPLKTRQVTTDIAQGQASAAASAAQANRTNVLLPGEVSKQAADIAKAQADADRAKADADKAKADLDAAVKAAGSNKQKAAVLRAQMLSSIRQYNNVLKGQPLTRGFGLFEGLFNESSAFGLIPPYAAFEAYDKTNQALLPLIRPMVAQSSREGDSDKEMQIFMSYIPTADDSDAAKEEKYRMLDLLISGVGEGKPPSQILASGAKPRSVDEIETSILKEGERLAKEERSGLSVMPEPGVDRSAPLPGRSNEPEYKTVPEETGLGVSDIERKNAAILQQALDEGADERELQDLAKALGIGELDSAKLRPVIEYRDNYLRQGGRGPSGALIVPRETPITPEKMAEVRALNSPVNAFLAKTGNALLASQGPNITSIFDPTAAELQQRSMDIYSEASPWASFGGTVLGSIPTTAGVAGGLMKAGLAPTRAAFLADLGYGATTGAGESPDNPLLGAITGAGTATLGSMAGRYALAPALEATGRGLSALSSKYGPKLAPKPTYGETAISGKLGPMDEIEQRLNEAARLELPMGLVDVSTPAQTLGRQTARRSEDIAGQAEAALGERAANRIDRLKESISKFVGQPYDDLRTAQAEIERAADDAAAPLYEKALSRPAPVDDKIDALLDTTLGRKGLQQAYTYAESRGVDPKALGFDLDDQGVVKLVQKPSWETLHYIRKGLQREIDQYRDPVTLSLDTKNPSVDNAQNFLRRFDKRLDYLNPDYAAAKSAWSQYIAPRDYLEQGVKALDPNTPPADVERTLARINAMPDATPEQAALKARALESYQRGFATAQRTAVDNARSANTDPYGVLLGTKRQQQKLNLIAPGASDFAKSAELEGRMLATEQVVKPSIPAASRAEAEAGLTGTNLLGAIGDTLLTGSPVLSAANLVRNAAAQPGVRGWLADTFGLGAPYRAGARAKELAPMLMDLNPEGALSTLQKAQQSVADYGQSVQAPRALGTYAGGLGAVDVMAEANRPEEYSVPQQPLSQGIVLDMVYGTGSKLNPDGSVTTRMGQTVPPEIVKQQIAEKAKAVTPYYGS